MTGSTHPASRTALARLGAALALSSALGLGAADPARAGELWVAAATSLREPVAAIAQGYEGDHPGDLVRLSFGASSLLAAQVRAGARIDVLLSADEQIVDRLEADGRVRADGRMPLAGNRLVVIQARDAGLRLRSAEDLADPRLGRIAIPARVVPVGRYAREWLAGRGLLERIESRLILTEHARATLAAVDLGHVDAAIVYATDARLARSARLAFEVPPEEQPRIVYTAARIEDSRAPREARRWLAYLRGERARSALAAAGFAPAPGFPR
jgi:molybdate transport system substrate-binding protein